MKNKRRSARLNTRLLSVALACILVPICVLGISWTQNSARLITEQTVGSAEARLTQTSRVLSLMFENVELLYEAIYTSDAVGEYASMADGAYLEKEQAPYQSLSRTNTYTKNKGDVRNLLMTQSSSLDVINSIYYYDVAKNVVMSYRYLDSTIERFFDLMWLQEINTAVKETVVLPVRQINPTYNEQYDVLSIVYMPYLKNIRQPIYIVFNLDANILYHHYLHDEEVDETDLLFLVDDTGRILLAGQGSSLLDPDDAADHYADYLSAAPVHAGSVSNDEMIISTDMVTNMNWRIISISSSATLQTQLMQSAGMIAAMILLVITLIAGVVIFVTRHTSYPARVILSENGTRAPSRLPRLLQDNEMLHVESWLQEGQAAMGYHFWNNAILGSIPEQPVGYYPRASQHFLLALIDVLSADDLPKNRASAERLQMVDHLQELYGDSGVEIVMMNHNTILVLLPCERDEVNRVSGLLADHHRSFAQTLENASLLAVGGWCETLYDVKECWMRATIMLRYQRLSGATQISYDMRAESYASGLGLRMWEMSNQLSTNLRQETWEEALLTLENIRMELKGSMASMDYLHIRHRMQHMLSTTLETYFRISPAEAVAAVPQDIYTRTLSSDSVDNVVDTCITLVRQMADSNAEETVIPENNEYVRRLLEMLEKDCGSGMSLSSAAEKLGLSSVYLGKIFKRVTGVNYVQYLTDLRMEKAKVMLLQDGVRIQDVAEALGYSQPHYFSKIFKQTTGMSPSEFVRNHGSLPVSIE